MTHLLSFTSGLCPFVSTRAAPWTISSQWYSKLLSHVGLGREKGAVELFLISFPPGTDFCFTPRGKVACRGYGSCWHFWALLIWEAGSGVWFPCGSPGSWSPGVQDISVVDSLSLHTLLYVEQACFE